MQILCYKANQGEDKVFLCTHHRNTGVVEFQDHEFLMSALQGDSGGKVKILEVILSVIARNKFSCERV
jgi:hypothetical protein